MAEYGKLLSRIWSDGQFVSLDARAQQLYCLLISYSTRNLAGVLPLTLKRWAKCTANTSVADIDRALDVLSANGFVVFDEDTEELLIRTFIRNDEVYRQPNLMKSALKFAQQVESTALRWVLHDELKRLPEPKVPDETIRVANMLVEGLIRHTKKGLPEGITEGLPEPPGVGVSYVGKENTSTFHLQPSPTPAAVAIVEPLAGLSATPGADLVRAIIPSEHPAAVQTALRIRASELLRQGHPRADVAAALELWLTKPHLGPNSLQTLLSEVIKIRAAPSGRTIGKPTQKALGIQNSADELIAEMSLE